jgi:flagellar motility protein MotE (MotC chaperone)
MRKEFICVVTLLSMVSCASKSDDIKAAYVSPYQYQDYSCKQIGKEVSRVSRKLGEISGVQDETASEDAVAMGVGLVLFWPALFFINSDDQKEEVARLKGEFDALEQAAIEKNCDIADDLQRARAAQEERLRQKKEEEARMRNELN